MTEMPRRLPSDQNDQAALAAKLLTNEVQSTKKDAAVALLGDTPVGHTKMSGEDGLALIGRRWGDPMFRQRLLTQVGDDQFLQIGEALGYYTPPPKMQDVIAGVKKLAKGGQNVS